MLVIAARDDLGSPHRGQRGRPVMLTNCKSGEGVEAVVDRLVEDVIFAA